MPLILETGGRWHPDVTNEIKRHLKDVHRSNRQSMIASKLQVPMTKPV